MCAPVLPILAAVGGAASIASSLGIIGGRNQSQSSQARTQTPPPAIKSPGPAAMGAGDDEKLKKELTRHR